MTYELMIAAIDGDPVAAKEVLAYFESYINRLCIRPLILDCGKMDYGVDPHMKAQLKGKLLRAMLQFTI